MTSSAEIFAANRATGRISVSVVHSEGRTRRERVHEAGSQRVRFPNTTDTSLEAVIVNTGGGMTGGDRFTIHLDVGAGAHLVAGTTAAEKIYRSGGTNTEIDVTLRVAAGGHLSWLPQETILFDDARLSRHLTIDLEAGASLVMAEAVYFGRAAMGETVRQGFIADRWRLRIGGKLVYADSLRFDGALSETLAGRAVTNGGVALATALIAPGSETVRDAVRGLEPQFRGEVGISVFNGLAVARLCANDGAALRHDLIALLAAAGTSVPRLWLQ